MLEITINRLVFFRKKHIWFSEVPFDVSGCHAVFFHACRQLVEIPGFVRSDRPTFIIDLTRPMDEIWKKMDQKSCRYFIKKAEKAGIEIEENSHFETFSLLVKDFAKKKQIQHVQESIKILRMQLGTLFVAKLENKLLGGAFTINNDARMIWLIGSSKRLEVDKEMANLISGANRLLIWTAIKKAKEMGLLEFDLGGYHLTEDKNDPRYGIYTFKKAFGGTPVIHYAYTKYYSVFYKIFKQLLKKFVR